MHRHRRAIHYAVQPATDREDRIANRLALQAAHAHAVQQFVGWILRFSGGVRWAAGHAVSFRKHDCADHFLGGPAFLDKIIGEPIEQLGMRGRLAEHAEVVRAGNDAAPKQVMPNAIGVHARGQRIRRIGNVRGQRKPASLVRSSRLGVIEGGQETARHFFAEIFVTTANEHLFVEGRAFEHYRHNRRARHGVGQLLVGSPVRQSLHR